MPIPPTILSPDPTQALPATLTTPATGTIPQGSDFDAAYGQPALNAIHRIGRYRLTDFAALRAVTNQVDGERMFVAFEGLYEWRASDTSAESLPWIVSPGGTGRWFHVDYNKRPSTNVFRVQKSANTVVHTNTGSADVTGSSLTIAVNAGDTVDVVASLGFDGTNPFVALVMVDGSTTDSEVLGDAGAVVYGGCTDTGSATTKRATITKSRTVTTTGNLVVKLKAMDNGGADVNVRAFAIVARVQRGS